NIAIRELTMKVQWMRRYRGAHVCPVVSLSDTFMNTRFGGRQRPHFIIHSWMNMAPEGSGQAALPSPEAPAQTVAIQREECARPAEAPAAERLPAAPPSRSSGKPPRIVKSKSFAIGDAVAPPSLREELNDSLPF